MLGRKLVPWRFSVDEVPCWIQLFGSVHVMMGFLCFGDRDTPGSINKQYFWLFHCEVDQHMTRATIAARRSTSPNYIMDVFLPSFTFISVARGYSCYGALQTVHYTDWGPLLRPKHITACVSALVPQLDLWQEVVEHVLRHIDFVRRKISHRLPLLVSLLFHYPSSFC